MMALHKAAAKVPMLTHESSVGIAAVLQYLHICCQLLALLHEAMVCKQLHCSPAFLGELIKLLKQLICDLTPLFRLLLSCQPALLDSICEG